MKLKRIIMLSVLLSLAVILGYVESFIPAFFIPGVKLGLANIVVLLCILNFKWYEAFAVSVLRIKIVSLILGSFLNVTFFMSLAGGILSFIIMCILSKIKILSPIFVSIVGAIAHTIGQIAVAIIVMDTIMVIYYLPFILLMSIPTGLLVGLVTKTIHRTNILKIDK